LIIRIKIRIKNKSKGSKWSANSEGSKGQGITKPIKLKKSMFKFKTVIRIVSRFVSRALALKISVKVSGKVKEK
jgi:hypothetical protein